MPRLLWDQIGQKTYETGVDHGVLYPQKEGAYPEGFAWNGLVSVTESPSGAEDSPLYADNIKYLNLKSAEEFGATIECYTYPDEWNQCNGAAALVPGVMLGQQRRNTFGLSYRTKLGNDTEGDDYGYKLHLIYAASASPSEISYSTKNDSPEANMFSYEITTTPIPIEGADADGNSFKPVASITIDSTKVEPDKLKALEDELYGTEGESGKKPRLPLPSELVTIFAAG